MAKTKPMMGQCQNLVYEVDEEGVLTIKVDLKRKIGPSASMKSVLVASTTGKHRVEVPERVAERCGVWGVQLNLILYVPLKVKGEG